MNNLLGFPGILRAAIDVRARRIDPSMYVAAANAIASRARENELVPNPLRIDVHRAVARAIAEAAQKAGVARVAVPSDYMLEQLMTPRERGRALAEAESGGVGEV